MIKRFKFFHGISNFTYYSTNEILSSFSVEDFIQIFNRMNTIIRTYETNR
jgi:hypothetical protein